MPKNDWSEDDHSAPSAEEWAKEREQVKAHLAAQGKRLWPEGSKSACPKCLQKALAGRDDLSLELPGRGHVIIFRHLQGARCAKCGYQVLEPNDQYSVEKEAGVGFHSDYEAKVSRIGSGTLGTYWPKDVQRVMQLQPQDVAYIHVIAPDTAVVKFAKPGAGAPA
jgi:hypothetical protein